MCLLCMRRVLVRKAFGQLPLQALSLKEQRAGMAMCVLCEAGNWAMMGFPTSRLGLSCLDTMAGLFDGRLWRLMAGNQLGPPAGR